ncbi:MAG: hypothetical protein CVU13_04785 [Bacteroidetes bacterium HGW-Bacteroidetes-8]|jgi:ferric-dicitrate binding protein FerR (iron transport regulator)|nr:MAG: hypothetical protein CVU13_04785 [Bacteroidetes bacterium HGW-Bacteroidetes-8]
MKKSTIIKYIKGDVSERERISVLKWASRNKANELYIARLKNIYISQSLPQEEASEEELNKIFELINKSDSLKKEVRENNYLVLSKIAVWRAASVILLLIVSALYFLNQTRKEYNPLAENSIKAIAYKNFATSKVLYTPKGVKAHLILPDSSQVWLNSDTRIEYPDTFDLSVRNVTISGEAYFSVIKNPQRPMVVKTKKGFSIEVLGTEFNLKAYEDDKKAQATLYSGEINLLREKDNKIISTKIEPNQTIIINSEFSGINVSKIIKETPADESAWKEGKIIFDYTPVSELIKTLERWHGVEFIVKDQEILNYRITATFNSESIVQIMDLIQLTSLIKYEVQNRKVILRKKY